MAEKNNMMEDSIDDPNNLNQSPGPLRTDVSNSTAQNTVARPQASLEDPNGINGGPSVGIEDSKFLLESSLNQNSISMPQDSKFSAGAEQLSTMKNVNSSRAEDMVTPDMIAQQRSQMEQQLGVVQSEHISSQEDPI